MTARERTAVSAPCRPARGHGGFTLLEVLVSLGIIIGALAGIAALLPAAGSRLADATNIDRAGTLAANARADLANRRLIAPLLWSGSAPPPAVVFGEGLPALTTFPAATSSIRLANLGGQVPTYVLQDGTVGGSPPGVCYGCMVSCTVSGSVPSGAPARMTTVIFQKPSPDVKQFTLTPRGGVFDVGTGASVADDRKRFLPGCSWVLSVGVGEPRWLQIGSSWTAFVPGQTTGAPAGTSSVTLLGSGSTSSPLQVFGFDGLLRLDERTVNLE